MTRNSAWRANGTIKRTFSTAMIGLLVALPTLPVAAGMLTNPDFGAGTDGWLDNSSTGTTAVVDGVAQLTGGDGNHPYSATLMQGDDGSWSFSEPLTLPTEVTKLRFDALFEDIAVDPSETGGSLFSDYLIVDVFDALDFGLDLFFNPEIDINVAGSWLTIDLDISSLAGRDTALSFSLSDQNDGRNSRVYLDNVQLLTQPVPIATLNLLPGLNLVGAAFDPQRLPTLADLLSLLGTADQVEQILRYDAETGRFLGCAHAPDGTLIGDGCAVDLVDGEGLVINGATTWSIDYPSALGCSGIDVLPGLNLIALNCVRDGLDVGTLMAELGGDHTVAAIQRFDHRRGRWVSTAWLSGALVGENFAIEPETAYRLSMREAVTREPPSADAGPDTQVAVGANVQLGGAGSAQLTYQWTLVERPASSTATLSGADGSQPGFVADQAGTYEIELVVSDALMTSWPDRISVQAVESSPP